MHTVSIDPRVEQLAQNRQPQSQAADSRPAVPGRAVDHGAPRLLVHTVRRTLHTDTAMRMQEHVSTPLGPVVADVVLRRAGRQVALLVGHESRDREAVLLVYGAFDAIYRVSSLDARASALAVVALLEAAEPALFGSGKTARLASLTSVRAVHTGRTTLTAEGWDGRLAATVHRRRINRPGEWAAEFDSVLDRPVTRRAS